MKLTPEEEELILKRRRDKDPSFTWEPRGADEYTDFEKIAAFDALHAQALEHYNGVRSGEVHEDNDADHYMFEAVMELLSRPKQPVWDSYNKFMQ